MNLRNRLIPGAAPAPRNQWYVAAFPHEITEKPLAREILGKSLVFFRDESGRPCALDDRCAHRAAALSAGKIIEGTIQCFYHGIRYDGSGRCVHIPSQSAIPPQMQVRSYPIVERWNWVWIWMGGAAAGDPSLVPDLSEFGLSASDFRYESLFKMDIEGNYQLLHENLLDVSHISFLHEGSFDTGAVARAVPEISVVSDRIRIEREVEEVLTGAYAATFEVAEGARMRRILRSESWAPAINVVTNVFHDLDNPEDDVRVHHAIFPITPRNDRSCHYFASTAKNFGCEFLPDFAKQAVWDIFLTDKEAIESIQRSYDALGRDTPDVSVRIDNAALRYRRIIEDMLRREGEADSPLRGDVAAE